MATVSGAHDSSVIATVLEIYRNFGVAYVADDDERTWGVSRSTPGAPFDDLEPGRRVRLALCDFECSSVVTGYDLLD